MRVLELCPCGGGVGWMFRERGHEVVTVDTLGRRTLNSSEGVLGWDYKALYPAGAFDVVVCVLPELVSGQDWARHLQERVAEVLEVVRYFRAPEWFIIGPRWSEYPKLGVLQDMRFVDLDTCCFVEAGCRVRLRMWGGPHPWEVSSRLCDYARCPHLVSRGNARGQPNKIPAKLVGYLLRWPQELDP